MSASVSITCDLCGETEERCVAEASTARVTLWHSGWTHDGPRDWCPQCLPEVMEDAVGMTTDRDVMAGRPVVRGTRVPTSMIADLIEFGQTPDSLALQYPAAGLEGIRHAIAFERQVSAFLYGAPTPAAEPEE